MSSKSLFNTTLIKKETKTLFPIIMANFLYMSFFFLYRNLQMIMQTSTKDYYQLDDFLRFYRNFPDLGNFSTEIFFMFIAGVMLFSSEKNTKTMEVLVTAPFSRLQIYMSKILTALLTLILPTIVIYIMTYTVVSSDPLIASVVDLKSAASAFAWAVQAKLFVIAYFVMVSMLFGSSLSTAVCGCVFMWMPVGLLGLATMFFEKFDKAGDLLRNSLKISPVTPIIYSAENVGTNNYILIIYSVLFLAGGYLLFDMYKMEKNGELLTFKWTEPIFIAGTVLCGAFAMGLLFEAMLYQISEYSAINKGIGFVIGAALGYIIPKKIINIKRSV